LEFRVLRLFPARGEGQLNAHLLVARKHPYLMRHLATFFTVISRFTRVLGRHLTR
jgi:hypothetical protein